MMKFPKNQKPILITDLQRTMKKDMEKDYKKLRKLVEAVLKKWPKIHHQMVEYISKNNPWNGDSIKEELDKLSKFMTDTNQKEDERKIIRVFKDRAMADYLSKKRIIKAMKAAASKKR